MNSTHIISATIKKCKLCYLLVFTLCVSNLSNSQVEQLKFNKIEGSNEITLGKINAIAKDGNGFMWFSDQDNRCIIRYDGSHMTRYRNNPKNPNSLGGYYPECLFIDTSGFIWIGFFGEGLDRFDPVTNTFTHYNHDPNDPKSLSNDFVTTVLIDHLDNIWIGTNDGLDLLDQKTGTFTHYKYDINDATSLSCNTVRAIYEDHEGTIWVGTGFAFDNINEGGLNRFDRDAGTFTRYMHDPVDPHSLIGDKVRAIFEDSKGNFWIGTNGDGLHSMDRKTGQFTRHTYDPAKPDQLSGPPVNINSSFNHVTFITEDADENLWIGSASGGINRYDPVTKKTTHFGNNADNSGQFIDNSGWCILASPDGLVWLGTQETNLYKIDLHNINIPQIIENRGVTGFIQESASVLWVGFYEEGLVRQNLKNGTTREFVHDPLNLNSLSNNNITRIFKDSQGIMWLGTESGLNRYDPAADIFTRYQHDPNDSSSIGSAFITDIVEDKGLNLWIGTIGGGLEMMDRSSGKFTHYRHNLADSNSLNWNGVLTIFDDETNDLWIGLSNNAGLDRLNKQTGRITNYLDGYSILDIFKDSNGILWVGTKNGLYNYERESDNFSPVVDQNKNININTAIYSIIGDNQDNLWMGTPLGIYKLNQARDNLILYGKENGVIGNILIEGSVSKLQDGKLLFGALNGYYAFYPDKFKTPSGTSNIYFTNLWLNGKSVNPKNNGALRESIFSAKKIQLNHDENTFAISASGIDYRHSGNKQLLYTLENYDQDWHRANVAEKMNYFKVPPGKYIFRIKSADGRTGEWLEKSIAVIITPPWWKTWWAYGTYAFMFLGGVFVIDRTQRRRLLAKAYADAREKELEQAKKIKKTYDELEVAHTSLKATQSQLIQSEKMASLGELTAGIAHEIQNPLNFVNNFSEVSNELIDEMNEEIEKGDLDEAKAIASDIKQNLEKINHHGKRADGIVKGMLQHSRSSSGQKEPTDINALTDEYLRLAYHGLRAKDKSFNATMDTDFDKTIGSINVVPQDLGRAILNLLTNAFYIVNEKKQLNIDDYKPTVSVSTRNIDNELILSISDNGNGIPKKVLDKIFQPFFTTKPTGQGTGLGLSLSYDIVKAHSGELKVETKEGEGTTFTISLPMS